ncbi:hypothetical protein VTH06DRAFT_7034 [Thermothelomyces fergusii]
MLEGDTAV